MTGDLQAYGPTPRFAHEDNRVTAGRQEHR